MVLYEFSLSEQSYSDPAPAGHGFRYQEFRYIYCVLLQRGKSVDFAEYLNQKQNLGVRSYSPLEFVDGPYLLESPWRDTWQGRRFLKTKHRMAHKASSWRSPIAYYHWESDRDKTLPNGFSRHLPQKWFADELGLKMADRSANSWKNSDGNTVLHSVSKSDGRSTVVIGEKTLMDYSDKYELEPVWIMIAERNAWPKDSDDISRRRV